MTILQSLSACASADLTVGMALFVVSMSFGWDSPNWKVNRSGRQLNVFVLFTLNGLLKGVVSAQNFNPLISSNAQLQKATIFDKRYNSSVHPELHNHVKMEAINYEQNFWKGVTKKNDVTTLK